ncbi:MAG: DUF4834 family protein [Rikenellaceae bacterium]
MIKSNPLIWVIIFLAVVAPSFLFGAVKVVLYIILGLILLFIILGFIFRVRVQTFRSQMEDQIRGGQGGRQGGGQGGGANPFGGASPRNPKEEGDVKIFATPQSQEKKVRNDVGDYVDFEEIKK